MSFKCMSCSFNIFSSVQHDRHIIRVHKDVVSAKGGLTNTQYFSYILELPD